MRNDAVSQYQHVSALKAIFIMVALPWNFLLYGNEQLYNWRNQVNPLTKKSNDQYLKLVYPLDVGSTQC